MKAYRVTKKQLDKELDFLRKLRKGYAFDQEFDGSKTDYNRVWQRWNYRAKKVGYTLKVEKIDEQTLRLIRL